MTCKTQYKRSSRTSRGFTLIEVIVAMTIMALITGVAFAGLSIGIDSWERGTRRIARLDQRISMERVIQRQLGLAYSQVFRGNSRELEFLSSYSLVNGSGDLMLVRYSMAFNKFLYSEKSATGSPSLSLTNTEMSTSSQGGFRYLALESGKAVWVNDWTQDGLPLAVEVELDGDVFTAVMVNRQ